MNEKFTVLMSIYIKENPEYFAECMNSILGQTVLPDQIVIVKDGPLTEDLEKEVNRYLIANPELYTIVTLETNQGLGSALAEGMQHCRNELVARMDTDDICRKDRFELQIAEFIRDEKLDICGSHIIEFEGSSSNIVAKRTVPLTDQEIKQYQKKRDAFNHVSVMFKKSTVLRAGNYQACLLMEDTLLWVNMILAGAQCKNIDDALVYVRIGSDMFERRGGLAYYKKYKEGRKKVFATGYISKADYYLSLVVQLIVASVPNRVRGWIFKTFLHR